MGIFSQAASERAAKEILEILEESEANGDSPEQTIKVIKGLIRKIVNLCDAGWY